MALSGMQDLFCCMNSKIIYKPHGQLFYKGSIWKKTTTGVFFFPLKQNRTKQKETNEQKQNKNPKTNKQNPPKQQTKPTFSFMGTSL